MGRKRSKAHESPVGEKRASICSLRGTSDGDFLDVAGLGHVPHAKVTRYSYFARIGWAIPTHAPDYRIAGSIELAKLQALAPLKSASQRAPAGERHPVRSARSAIRDMLISRKCSIAKRITSIVAVNEQE